MATNPVAPTAFPATASVQQLDRKHPNYTLFSPTWAEIEILSEAGARLRQAGSRFLTKRPKEQIDIYEERLRGLFSTPILGTVLGWYASALFRRQPGIDPPESDSKFFGEFLSDCDNSGRKFTEYWRRTFEQLASYGISWTLIDKPSSPIAPESLADERDFGLDRVYLVNYEPIQVINWGTDQFGNLDWVVVKTLDEETEFLAEKPKSVTHWTYYDRTAFARYEADTDTLKSFAAAQMGTAPPTTGSVAKRVDTGAHALSAYNLVPFEVSRVPANLWLANRTFSMLKQYLNQENSYAWGLYMGNLEMPVLFTDQGTPDMTRSEASYWQFGTGDRVEWSGPSGRTFASSAAYLDGLREDIYRAFYLQAQGRSSRATASAQSGYSKQMDMMPANDVLNAYGDLLRQGMENMLNSVALARGLRNASATVTGFRFETHEKTESIALAQEFKALEIQSDTADKVLQKRVVRDVFEDERPDNIEKMVAEIDAAPSASQLAAQQQDQQSKLYDQQFAKLSDRQNVRGELESLGDQ